MPLRLDQVALSVLDALARDYAGMPECDDGNGQAWARLFEKAGRARQLYDRNLWQHLQRRLACLHDANLCFLTGPNASYTPQTCGFETRRLGDRLLVTRAGKAVWLQPGDAIVAVNQCSLDEKAAQGLGDPFEGVPAERQDWSLLLAEASRLQIRRADGSEKTYKVRLFPASSAPLDDAQAAPAFSLLADGAAYLRVDQFDDDAATRELTAHAEEARRAPRLVIDLRRCTGGSEANAYGLLDWLFDADTNLDQVQEPETVLTNYTEANCARREQQIAQLRLLATARPEAVDPSELSWLDENLAIVRANRGRGFVEETVQPGSRPILAAPAGQRVALLTDTTTADAAEWLARVAGKSPRVIRVGRATAGNLDYSNPLSISFEDRFVFVYPMSKTKAASQGKGIRGHGIQPDVPVPFTQKECFEDTVLARALEVLADA